MSFDEFSLELDPTYMEGERERGRERKIQPTSARQFGVGIQRVLASFLGKMDLGVQHSWQLSFQQGYAKD